MSTASVGEPLSYESRTPAEVEPGETVLWEASVPKRYNMPACTYRVTDRRAVVIAKTKPPTVEAVRLDAVKSIEVRVARGGVALISIAAGEGDLDDDEEDRSGFIAMTRLRGDWRSPILLILSAAMRSDRAIRRRRWRAQDEDTMPNEPVAPVDPVTTNEPLPPEVLLVAGEAVLWTGRPVVHYPIDAVAVAKFAMRLFWLALPTMVVANWWGVLSIGEGWPRVPGWTAVVGICWIAIWLWMFFVTTPREVLTRKGTRYILTNRRMIQFVSTPRELDVRSSFLDLATRASFTERRDGCGDVGTDYATTFMRVRNVRQVHALVVATIDRMTDQRAPRTQYSAE